MKIVGLVGPKRSGKDTAADALVKHRGFAKVGFADAVKELALRIDPVIPDDYDQPRTLAQFVGRCGWERAKEEPEVRRFLQELGTGVRDIGDGLTWITAWWLRVAAMQPDGLVVVPDVRFLNEARAIDTGLPGVIDTLLIRVTRPGLDLSDTHVSETEQAGIRCDAELVNDGTPEELQAKVLALVDGWSTS